MRRGPVHEAGRAFLGGGRVWKELRPCSKISGKLSGESGVVFELGGEGRFFKNPPEIF